MKIAVIVVTFNRLFLLKNCINAINNQTLLPNQIIVINNSSTDGTLEWLMTQKQLFIKTQENIGGAGGFSCGLKIAYDKGFEWMLCLDDDGLLEKNAINQLLIASKKLACKALNCLIININNPKELSFPVTINSKQTFNYDLVKSYNGKIEGGNPFNGLFIHRDVIKIVGLPNARFFIKGDEKDYNYRILNHMKYYTYKEAILLHPKPQLNQYKLFGKIIYSEPNDIKSYYYIRNKIWLKRKFKNFNGTILSTILKAIIEIIFKKNGTRLVVNIKAIIDGLCTNKNLLFEGETATFLNSSCTLKKVKNNEKQIFIS